MGVDLVVKHMINQLVEKTLSVLNMTKDCGHVHEPGEISLFTRGRQRAFVKVQDGPRRYLAARFASLPWRAAKKESEPLGASGYR